MADIKWIKLQTNMFGHKKIKQIKAMPEGKAIILIWVQILCLAGSSNRDGGIYFTEEIPYTEEMLITEFGETSAIVRLALYTFSKFNMIEIIDDIVCVSNWSKYQSADKLAKIREQTRVRVQNYREQKKLPSTDVTQCNDDVTQCNGTELRTKNLELRTKNKESTGAGAPAPSPIKDPKHEYGDNGWVKLTDKQHNKLINDLGQAEFERCVSYVDESAQISTNKNGWKDWNAVLRKAHREEWGVKKSWSKPISEKDNVNKVYDESRPF